MSTSLPIAIHLPDMRGVTISPFGNGNFKIGFGVYTYSRLAVATCPGRTRECEEICYAKRISGPVKDLYALNSQTESVPELPGDCQILRIHVSGDFDTVPYIESWIARLTERPDVTAWAYTRSWRVPALLAALEGLRSLPNVQLFASMDPGTKELPPAGWRRAWIWRTAESAKASGHPMEARLSYDETGRTTVIADGTPSYVCPEETKAKRDCLDCGYCFEGKKHDVTFLEH